MCILSCEYLSLRTYILIPQLTLQHQRLTQQLSDVPKMEPETPEERLEVKLQTRMLKRRLRELDKKIAGSREQIEEGEGQVTGLLKKRIQGSGQDSTRVVCAQEGVYACVVRNSWLGDYVRQVVSREVVVCAGRAEPVLVKVRPVYVPKERRGRGDWEKYDVICGTWERGMVKGEVAIRYVMIYIYIYTMCIFLSHPHAPVCTNVFSAAPGTRVATCTKGRM